MKDRISISVVWHDHRKPLVIVIKKSLIKRLALVFAFFFAFWVSLQVWGLWNYWEKTKIAKEKEEVQKSLSLFNEERSRLQTEKERLSAYKQKVKELEGRLLQVEEYLRKRGIALGSRGLGGRAGYRPEEEEEYLSFIVNRSEELMLILKSIPAGYPLYGTINSTFGWRKNPFGRGYEFHTGVDIDAPYGAPVRATADGVVSHAGRFGDYGKAVVIEHGHGYSTLYGHLSQVLVKEGQKVKAGDIIGRVGSTGRSTGAHLHYEVLFGGKPVNPMDYLVWR